MINEKEYSLEGLPMLGWESREFVHLENAVKFAKTIIANLNIIENTVYTVCITQEQNAHQYNVVGNPSYKIKTRIWGTHYLVQTIRNDLLEEHLDGKTPIDYKDL